MTTKRHEEITIDFEEREGDVQVRLEVHGVSGRSCEDLTAEVEAALGEVKSHRRKREYFQTRTRAATRQRGRS